MKITIVAAGSRGDVQPYLALAKALKKSGHDICLATHESFRNFVTEHGIDFAVIEGNPQEVVNSEEGRILLESGANPFKALKRLGKLMQPYIRKAYEDIFQIAQGTDLIIFGLTSPMSLHVAEKLKIPAVYAILQPLLRSRDLKITPGPEIPLLKYLFNYFGFLMIEQILWQPVHKTVNQCRRELLELAPLNQFSAYDAFYKKISNYPYSPVPTIVGISPSVVKKPSDWKSWMQMTGYWFLESGEEWQAPEQLTEFISAGEAPVYIGFGSMSNRDPRETADIALKALKKANKRGIILTGWGGMHKSDSDEQVLFIDSAPHDWLFPKMCAVVHHGGAGTTSAGLKAGVPSIVIPFFGDQPYWADTVYSLGVGPKPVPREKLTVEKLSQAIIQATSEPSIISKASELGKKIRAENGPQNAVKIIEQYIKSLS